MQKVQSRQTVEDKPFYELSPFAAVFNGLKIAGNRTDCKRLVIYLAPQGGGKTALIDAVAKRIDNVVKIVVQPSWRNSYHAACSDVCNSMGLIGPWRSTKEVERDMLQALGATPFLLAFDEGNTLGPDSLNMIKIILNQTRCTVLLCALPGLFDQMSRAAWFESAQVVRRAVAIIDLEQIRVQPDDVRPFLKGFHFNGAGPSAMQEIADAANRFAAFDMVETVASYLGDIVADAKEATIDHVHQAIATAEKMWRLDKRNIFLPPPKRKRGRPRKEAVNQ